MSNIDKLLKASTKKHEGLRLAAYPDTKGIWTIGYGHNLEANGVPAKYARFVQIPQDVAEAWLDADLENARKEAEKFEQFPFFNRARRNVFIEMVFQMGSMKVSRFKNMLGAISLNPSQVPTNWAVVAEHMLDSKWARKDTPSRARELAETMRVGWYG